jgi:hypothetical protein
MAASGAADDERGRLRFFAGDHRDAAAGVANIDAGAIGSDPGVIEVNMKGARVRICANAPSGVIAATLKALRP